MRVGTYLGIPVKVNPLFFVLLLGAASLAFFPSLLSSLPLSSGMKPLTSLLRDYIT